MRLALIQLLVTVLVPSVLTQSTSVKLAVQPGLGASVSMLRSAHPLIKVPTQIRWMGATPPDARVSAARPRIWFVNAGRGWLVAGGHMWRTTDSGANWTLIYTAKDPRGWIGAFRFAGPRLGWMIAGGEGGAMYVTRDGGATWSSFPEPMTANNSIGPESFWFSKDGLQGWVVGAIYVPLPPGALKSGLVPNRYLSPSQKRGLRGAVFSTRDGGEHWTRELLTSDWGILNHFFALDGHHAWVTGEAGCFYYHQGKWQRTDHGGVGKDSATRIRSLDVEIGFPDIEPVNIFFLDAGLGWVSNSNGYLGRSTDGGRTWRDLWASSATPGKQRAFFSKVAFANASNGIACQDSGRADQSRLWVSADAGTTWQPLGAYTGFSDLCLGEDKSVWAVAKDGVYRVWM